jgi:hypothetical protein
MLFLISLTKNADIQQRATITCIKEALTSLSAHASRRLKVGKMPALGIMRCEPTAQQTIKQA